MEKMLFKKGEKKYAKDKLGGIFKLPHKEWSYEQRKWVISDDEEALFYGDVELITEEEAMKEIEERQMKYEQECQKYEYAISYDGRIYKFPCFIWSVVQKKWEFTDNDDVFFYHDGIDIVSEEEAIRAIKKKQRKY